MTTQVPTTEEDYSTPGCELVDTTSRSPVIVDDDGVFRQLHDGEVINAAGTTEKFWTVAGRGLLFDDGTSTSPCIPSNVPGLIDSVSLQLAYDNSTIYGGAATIKLDTNKDLAVLKRDSDELFFKIDSDTGNIVITKNVSIDGDAGIAKDLTVGGLINGIDIVKHVSGQLHRHMAADVDIIPIASIPEATNVQQALENLKATSVTNGMQIPLAAVEGLPTDGSWTPGAINISDATLVTDAIDGLNGILSKLIPSQPPNLGNIKTLSVASAGSLPLKADGPTPDNTNGGVLPAANTAGNPVQVANQSGRIVTANVTTNTIMNVGSGTEGVLAAVVNGSKVGNELPAFTAADAPTAVVVGSTIMTGRSSFPVSTPGFWKSFNVQASMTGLNFGWNRVSITHSTSGSTNEFYMLRDNLTDLPVMTASGLAEVGGAAYAYSSGVPHYGDATATLTASGLSMTNVAGETYYGGNPVSFTGANGIALSQEKSFTDLNVAVPIARQTLSVSMSGQTISVNGTDCHNLGNIRATATNVNGVGVATNVSNTIVLVKRGSAVTRVDEMSIPVTGLGSSPNSGNAVRRGGYANADQPALGGDVAWSSSAALSAQEAAVVGGILSHNQTNYSVGYLPLGPNLSAGRAGSQYFTCKFQRESRSNFKIVVAGTYTRCWVALPGISSVTSSTGWWDMGIAFSGSGFPGNSTGNGSNGCAEGSVMAGSGGTFTCTFGTKSSSNSTNNDIIVRFKLAAGQSITSLRFTN